MWGTWGLGVKVKMLEVSVEGKSSPTGLILPISQSGGNWVPNKSPNKAYRNIKKNKTPQKSFPEISTVGEGW
jgi:hypothetical protein